MTEIVLIALLVAYAALCVYIAKWGRRAFCFTPKPVQEEA